MSKNGTGLAKCERPLSATTRHIVVALRRPHHASNTPHEASYKVGMTETAHSPVGWLPKPPGEAQHPHWSRAFADAYERTATRITGPISFAALQLLGTLARDARLLDIGAGSGAFSVPAAHAGFAVTAIDIAPGLAELLSERLRPFPRARALVMDGQALDFADRTFDAVVSIVGVSIFQDWRQGLAEQVRVLRPGGTAVLATWRTLPGGGPFVIMAEALRATFPDQPTPSPPPGFLALAEPDAMRAAFNAAGLTDVSVEEIEAVWEGPAGPAYLEELRDLHPFMGSYALLDAQARARLDAAILKAVERRAAGGRLVLKTQVTMGTGKRA